MTRIVILTGAGISAESGLGTFRDAGGLWATHRLEDVATPEAFHRDPVLVHQFYNARRQQAAAAIPNAAHKALARLEATMGHDVLLVTQNVDDLHEKAGSRNVLHMHGRLAGALCHVCGHRWIAPPEMRPEDSCPSCRANATRPDVVWFGEYPHGMDRIEQALSEAAMFAAIGTSGQVYPAAGFVMQARQCGADTVELNLEPSETSSAFAQTRLGKASEIVSLWVDELLDSVPQG
ncbi:MAG: NAD-dependent deacylase [Pseudomonadota bacterium]